jgi:hypothetical protein
VDENLRALSLKFVNSEMFEGLREPLTVAIFVAGYDE